VPSAYRVSHLKIFAGIPFKKQGAVGSAPSRFGTLLGLQNDPDWAQLQALPLDRDQVKKICRDVAFPIEFGYISAMAWGMQSAGNARMAWKQRARIADHLLQVRAGDLSPKDAFDLFCGTGKVAGLGPSYFTKLLYFFNPNDTCYIMDQWTGKSINLLTGKHLYIVDNTSANTGDIYQAFCDEIDQLAKLLGQTGEEIEQRLFSQGGRKREPWREYVRQHYPGNQSETRQVK
jgi:hypothetical protein